MAEACAAKGYEAASVADAVAAAGASREEFYEHFRDKQECFLAGLDSILADVVSAVSGYYSPDKPWFQVLRDGLESLVSLLESDPARAKLALVEAPPAGPAAYERYAAGKRVLVSLVDQGRADAPPDVILPSSAAQLACGAAEAVIADELIAGRATGLRNLMPEMLYSLYVPFMEHEQAISLSGVRPDEDPPGSASQEADPASLEIELPGPGRRTDVIEAMIKVSVREGYEGASVEEVIAEAGIDHDAFYELFPDKQACFLATFDFILDHVVYGVKAAFEAETQPSDRARAGLAALLDWFSAEPRMAHLAIVGMASAGPAAHRHYRRAVRRFLPLFAAIKRTAPLAERLPDSVSRLALGSITELLFDEIQAGRTDQLPRRLGDLVFAALVPYLGTREASAQMRATASA